MINLFLFTLLLGLAVGHFTFIFHFTEFVVQYARLFRVSKLFKVNEYFLWKEKENIEEPNYPAFLRESYQNFIAHLFGCAICTSTFFSVVLSVFSFSWFFLLAGFSAAGIAWITFCVEKFLFSKINN